MFRVGLTGGIGSGKSTVARIFEVIGIPVYYADSRTKALMNNDPELRKELIKQFGEKSYNAEGLLDRAYISSLVFGDETKLKLLNAITHPIAIRDSAEWMKKQQTGYSIKEAALIFESGSHKFLDYVIGVSSPLSLRIKRIQERDGSTEEQVLEKMSRQMNEAEKMKLCDTIIINDEKSSLIEQVLQLHQKLLKLAESNATKSR